MSDTSDMGTVRICQADKEHIARLVLEGLAATGFQVAAADVVVCAGCGLSPSTHPVPGMCPGWPLDEDRYQRWRTDPSFMLQAGELDKAFARARSERDAGAQVSAIPRQLREFASAEAANAAVRDVLEALCVQQGISLDSAADPGNPARNFELAMRLGIGHVFGIAGGSGE